MKLSNSTTNIIASILLGICFLLAFLSGQNMSLTMDEKAHIPSGYSYLAFQDYRLNPEHPPLAKDISAVPLLFLNLNFPTDHPCWTEDVNGQWDCGEQFIFKSGNDPDQIIFWSRLPMMFLLVLLGWFIFFWVKKLGGNKPALFALTLFSFSPAFLAHGLLVTTDIAAVLGFLLATYFWLKFLKSPKLKNIFIAGIMLGIALCMKFSLILLIPSFAVITVIYACLKAKKISAKIKLVLKYIGLSIIVGIISFVVVVWPLYQFHIINYSPEHQINDTEAILDSDSFIVGSLLIPSMNQPILRPISQYALGVLMATQRVAGGNTVYFLGQVSRQAWKHYFPVVYLLKVPLSFHILTVLVLLLWLASIRKAKLFQKGKKRFRAWLTKYFTPLEIPREGTEHEESISLTGFTEFSLVVFFVIYWATSITGNLNIGVRHILPIFPIMYILVSLGLFRLIEKTKRQPKLILGCVAAGLMLWYVIASLLAFPHFLSYYNELACGSKNGYKYAVDSNYDWGQDLKRLNQFVEENNIQEITVAYFGGDNPQFRLGDKIKQTWPDQDPEKNKGWLAISATLLQEGRGVPARGYDRDTTFFNWLNQYEPIRIGNSIFVYYID